MACCRRMGNFLPIYCANETVIGRVFGLDRRTAIVMCNCFLPTTSFICRAHFRRTEIGFITRLASRANLSERFIKFRCWAAFRKNLFTASAFMSSYRPTKNKSLLCATTNKIKTKLFLSPTSTVRAREKLSRIRQNGLSLVPVCRGRLTARWWRSWRKAAKIKVRKFLR